MTMAAYTGSAALELRESTVAEPGPSEVRIRVAYVGICGTDLHILHGAMDHRITQPHVLGHEMSGIIDSVGPDTEGWSVGDRVTVMPLQWDGTCPACLAGNTHICQNLDFMGIDTPGALQSLWVVPADTLVRLPDDITLADAALIEPTAVAVHDVRRSELVQGDRCVVLGGGPVGLLIASVARRVGAEVIIVETDSARRAIASELGFETLDPAAGDVLSRVTEWTGDAGADVVFEVSGAPAAVLSATSLLKVRGTLVVVAIHPKPQPVDLQRVFWRELRLLGARVYQRTDFDEAARLLAAGVIPAEQIVSVTLPIAEIARLQDELASGRAMKVLVSVGDDA